MLNNHLRDALKIFKIRFIFISAIEKRKLRVNELIKGQVLIDEVESPDFFKLLKIIII